MVSIVTFWRSCLVCLGYEYVINPGIFIFRMRVKVIIFYRGVKSPPGIMNSKGGQIHVHASYRFVRDR